MLIASLELHEHLEVCPLFLHDPHKALETEQVSRLRNLPVSLNRAAAFAHSQILQRGSSFGAWAPKVKKIIIENLGHCFRNSFDYALS